jgi:collagen type I alpha
VRAGKPRARSAGGRKSSGRRVAASMAIASVSAVMMGVGPAGATAPARIYACYSNTTGEMFRVDSSTTCPSGETKIDWNVAGAQGSQGSRGSQGAAGARGAAGSQGAKGLEGAAGPQGATGARGAAGSQGASGTRGATGSQGASGALGARGAQGSRGAQGATGAAGPAGPQGPNGAQGATGTTPPAIAHEYNFETSGSAVLSQSEMSASTIVATVTPVPGIYNVVATATMNSHGDRVGCHVAAVSSHGTARSSTPVGYARGSTTTAETGAVSVRAGGVIVEICAGTSLEGGSFFPGTVHAPTLTAIAVTHASGTITAGPLRAGTDRMTGGRPANSFTQRPRSRLHR